MLSLGTFKNKRFRGGGFVRSPAQNRKMLCSLLKPSETQARSPLKIAVGIQHKEQTG